jgi:uncharacterized protein YecT (DUF1311 family)
MLSLLAATLSCGRSAPTGTTTPPPASPSTSARPAPAASPDDAQADPCRGATTQGELTRCWSGESRQAGEEARAALRRVVSWLRDRGSEAALRAVENGDATWTAYRDAQCAAVAAVYDAGSLGPMQEARCRAGLAHARRRELDALMSDASH